MGLSSMATKLELIAFDDLWPTAPKQFVLKSPLSHLVSDSLFVSHISWINRNLPIKPNPNLF